TPKQIECYKKLKNELELRRNNGEAHIRTKDCEFLSPPPNSTFDNTCYYENVYGLKSKTTFYNSVLSRDDLELILSSETWLSSSVFDAELFPSNYTIDRSDRKFSTVSAARDGGVLIAVKNSLYF
ncbi:unnamed protein product, partial [Acanthoscelides obtectus]